YDRPAPPGLETQLRRARPGERLPRTAGIDQHLPDPVRYRTAHPVAARPEHEPGAAGPLQCGSRIRDGTHSRLPDPALPRHRTLRQRVLEVLRHDVDPRAARRRHPPVPRQRPLLSQCGGNVRVDELGAGADRAAHSARRFPPAGRRGARGGTHPAGRQRARRHRRLCRRHAGARTVRRALLPGAGGRMKRRTLIAAAPALLLQSLSGCKAPKPAKPAPVVVRPEPVVPLKLLDPLLDDLQKRTFNFFWETAEPGTGLIPDRWPRPPFSSMAAVGFALNAYAIGAERGWVTRAQARARTLGTLRFLRDAQQDTSPDQATGYQGFFYHFVNFTT